MSQPLLELRDVGVRAVEMRQRERRENLPMVLGARVKERTWPIRHLDFTLQRGEIVFVIDLSRSKPSVFFRLVCGLIQVDEGEATMPRRTVLASGSRAKLIRALSLGQAIRLQAGLLGMTDKGIDRHFDAIVEFAEVSRKLHLPVDTLPKSLLAQASFATAVFVPADLYAFDNTAFVGPAEFRNKCGIKLRDMAAAGKGLLIHSHNARLARQYADRGLVLDGESARILPAGDFAQLITLSKQGKVSGRGRRRRRRKRDE